MARLIKDKLAAVACTIEVELLEVIVDKSNPGRETTQFSADIEQRDGDVVVVVDDVLYTGRTMMHSIMPFVHRGFQKVQVAVLVFRDYLRYPISPDFVGMALASTTQQHVEVILSGEVHEAYLN